MPRRRCRHNHRDTSIALLNMYCLWQSGGKSCGNLLINQYYFFPDRPMKTGRPPNWNPVAALSPSAWTEVVGLSSKSRLQLPIAIRSRLAWLSQAQDGLLAVLEPNGSAKILCWKPHGEAELEAVRGLLKSTNELGRGMVAIAAMDRFLKLTFDLDGRTVLPINLACHLNAAGPDAVVRVVTVDGQLWMWSETEWQRRRLERAALLNVAHD